MSTAGLLFPGQGAQHVGMGAKLYETSAAARQVFDRANDATDVDLKRYCFEGPEEDLNRTDISQPAILVTSLAVLEALREAGKLDLGGIAGAAGLSLGEYTALAAVGALQYEDAIRIVSHRGRFMQEACDQNPGGMASILGLPIPDLEEICREASAEGEICLANYNSPAQVAIGGTKGALERACKVAEERGARVFPLKVAGAFHSKLMSPAAEKLAPMLRELDIAEPKVAVVANVTGAKVTEPEAIRDCLIRQVDHPVQWIDCMETSLADGIRDYLEIGPGRVLAGLMRKIDRSAKVTSLSSPDDIEKL